jgi:CheY-like chemotaxis protein
VRSVVPVTAAANVKSDVRRIAVVDDPAAWQDVKLHGVETLVLAPSDELAARLAAAPVDRVLVNLATRGAFDSMLGARAAGTTVPFCGCLIPPGLARGLMLGFIEIARTPLDPDEITTVLAPYAVRGTRVLTAGADADAFISLRQALSRQGMSVSMAWDGKQASDLLQMVRPEVVIVDLDIPPRSGLALIVELTAAPIMPMLVLLPGRQDVSKRTAADLADPGLASRLLPPERLLDEVRRIGKPKA